MLKQLEDLGRMMLGILYGVLNAERVQYWWEHQDEFKEKLTKLLLGEKALSTSATQDSELTRAQAFYSKHFGVTPDFSGVIIPPKPEGNYRLAVVAQGMTPNKAYDTCAKLFPCWRYRKNLDVVMERDVRKTDKSYAIWLYAGPEAEEEFANKSFNDLEATRHQRLTLTERLLLEIIYFEETGEHLDRETVTRCDGSRYPEGDVPGVYWYALYGKLYVRECNPGDRRGDLRSRSAVS